MVNAQDAGFVPQSVEAGFSRHNPLQAWCMGIERLIVNSPPRFSLPQERTVPARRRCGAAHHNGDFQSSQQCVARDRTRSPSAAAFCPGKRKPL